MYQSPANVSTAAPIGGNNWTSASPLPIPDDVITPSFYFMIAFAIGAVGFFGSAVVSYRRQKELEALIARQELERRKAEEDEWQRLQQETSSQGGMPERRGPRFADGLGEHPNVTVIDDEAGPRHAVPRYSSAIDVGVPARSALRASSRVARPASPPPTREDDDDDDDEDDITGTGHHSTVVDDIEDVDDNHNA